MGLLTLIIGLVMLVNPTLATEQLQVLNKYISCYFLNRTRNWSGFLRQKFAQVLWEFV